MTNEQQPNQPLTRRQLRELRSTGATPILTPEGTPVMPPAQEGAPEPATDVAATGEVAESADAAQSPATEEPADDTDSGEPTSDADGATPSAAVTDTDQDPAADTTAAAVSSHEVSIPRIFILLQTLSLVRRPPSSFQCTVVDKYRTQ